MDSVAETAVVVDIVADTTAEDTVSHMVDICTIIRKQHKERNALVD